MVLDHAGIAPNPARDRVTSGFRGPTGELAPPTAAHVEAVYRLLPSRYRLPLVVLDATGMRVGELEALTLGRRRRAARPVARLAAASKTGRARWVPPPPDPFAACAALVPRDDRDLSALSVQGVTADRFRTAINRACTRGRGAAFSPHDLRHRRISLLHLGGVPWAGSATWATSLAVTADTYTHVLADERELDYLELLRAR